MPGMSPIFKENAVNCLSMSRVPVLQFVSRPTVLEWFVYAAALQAFRLPCFYYHCGRHISFCSCKISRQTARFGRDTSPGHLLYFWVWNLEIQVKSYSSPKPACQLEYVVFVFYLSIHLTAICLIISLHDLKSICLVYIYDITWILHQFISYLSSFYLTFIFLVSIFPKYML